MQEIYFHLGAHKTGSTFLQSFLSKNSSILIKEGIYYIPQKDYWPYLKEHYLSLEDNVISGKEITENQLYELSKITEDKIKEAIPEGIHNNIKKILISHEDLSGSTRIVKQKRLYPAFNYFVGVLSKTFIGLNKNYIYTIRRQDQFLDSCILQQIQQGAKLDIDNILNNLQLAEFDWSSKIKILSNESSQPPLILSSELSAISKLEQAKRLISYLGANDDLTAYEQPSNVGAINPSLSKTGLKIALASRAEVTQDEWSKIRLFLRNNFSSNKSDKARILPPSVSELIRLYYNEENKKILDEHKMSSLKSLF